MSTVALYTAKGAPGATTDAMLISALWPRRTLLIDCDPAGGDIALRLPAADGSTLDVSVGMLSLLPMARRPMQPADVLAHAQVALGGGELLAGLASPDQAVAAGTAWQALAELFANLPEHDVVMDLGRLHPTSAVLPLAQRADLAVCVVHASLTGTIAARARLRSVLPALAREGAGPRTGFVVRAQDRRTAETAGRVLQEDFPELQYFGWLADDPVGASLFEGGRVARPERTMLVRSGAAVVKELDAALVAATKRGEQSPTLHVAMPDDPAPAAGETPAEELSVADLPLGALAADEVAVGTPAHPGRAAERAAQRAERKRSARFRRRSSV